MAITTLCAVVAVLKVIPNRSVFFEWESVSLSCGLQGNSSGWKLKKNISYNTNQEWFKSCSNDTNESHCVIDDLIPLDSGDYWCESEAGECSETVRITVTAGSVLLESPVLPVMEGDHVTMLCRTQKKSSSGLTTDFYKDGVLIGSSSTGNLTFHSVAKSDEGFYKCNISGAGESPDVWLTVRNEKRGCPEPLHSALAYILLPVVVKCLLLICTMLLCLLGNRKGEPGKKEELLFGYEDHK